MARRRMFTAELIESDRFSELPVNVQMLYVYMGVNADDEGFVSSPKRMARFYDCPEGLAELEKQGFIITFESGVVVLVDWYINNTIRKDRSIATIHQAERQRLAVVDGRYVLSETDCQPLDNQAATQNISEKNITENNRIGQNSPDQSACGGFGDPTVAAPHRHEEDCMTSEEYIAPNPQEVYDYCQDNGLGNISAMDFWSYYDFKSWKDEMGLPIRDWRALVRTWNSRAIELSSA